jgi:AcrR family transcriptional regulator
VSTPSDLTMEPDHPAQGTARRPGRPRDPRSHAAILEATREVLVEVGYPNLTMEEVARVAGVGKATIYRWWDSKLHLVLEAAAPHLEIGLVPDTGTTRDDLMIAADQVINTYADPIAAIVIYAVIADLEQDVRLRDTFRTRWVLPWRTSLAEAIERGVARGDFAPGTDIPLVVDLMVGIVFQRVLIVPEPMTGGLAEAITDLVLEGKLPTRRATESDRQSTDSGPPGS